MNFHMRSRYKSIIKFIGSLLFFVLVFALSSCASKARAEDPSCSVDLGMRVTIHVTDVKPQVVIDQLAANPDCAITVSPFLRKHVTLQVEKATVSEVLAILCPQIGCKWILNDNHLTIRLYTIIDKWQDYRWEAFNKMMEERRKILQSDLPEGMAFENAPLSTVLKEISKVSGLTIKAWKDEGDRKVTLDVSGMTVEEAIKAILLSVDSEGAVLIREKYFLHHSWGQYWPWGYPPTQ